MTVEREVSEPSPEAVMMAVKDAVGRCPSAVTPFEEGMNPVYRVSFDGRDDLVFKFGTVTPNEKLLSEPVLLDRLRSETTIPVPEPVAAVPADESRLDGAYFLMEYVPGRTIGDVPTVLDLPPEAHEQLVEDAGRYLARLHSLEIDGGCGRLRGIDGDLVVIPGMTWLEAYRATVEHRLDGMTDGRFADLIPAVRRTIDAFRTVVADRSVDLVIVHDDYHLKNLVLEPDDEADPLTRAVLDWGFRSVGDAAFSVASAEAHLIDLQLGGTDRAVELRERLRTAYTDERGVDGDRLFDERYPYYRLDGLLRFCSRLEYWAQFGREETTDGTVRRLRGSIESLCSETARS